MTAGKIDDRAPHPAAASPATSADVARSFRSVYGSTPRLFRAPGRVNIIGEHTDYNDGFVLPAAIDRFTTVAAAPNVTKTLAIRSGSNTAQEHLGTGLKPRGTWSDYVFGVVDQFERAGAKLSGADVLIHGEVPIGAGLSSSAALEVSTALMLQSLNGSSFDRRELALLCQRAENEFVGMRCGIMDQFISANGKQGHALLLDCRTLQSQLVPIPGEIDIVVCNTMVKHQLASGEYNTRRAECEEGVRLLRRWYPQARALRDVSIEQWRAVEENIPEPVRRRCRHVITEDDRVLAAGAAFRSGDLHRLRDLMLGSHRSLRDDYEVSCPELDIMVTAATDLPGVYGARMTGGGFGGCTVNLVAREYAHTFVDAVAQHYQERTGIYPDIYICRAAEGASEIATSDTPLEISA